MKYMTFNSSCSYAGVANMLEQYGVDTDDRSIALEMKLPFLFAREAGMYLAGPMLQSSKWFNLYLNPMGYTMTEAWVERKAVPAVLQREKPAMLGLHVSQNSKHAVVYLGMESGSYLFLNNKWRHTDEPEQFVLSEEELLRRLDEKCMIAVLHPVRKKAVDFQPLLVQSVLVLAELKRDIQAFCCVEQTPQAVMQAMNTMFRAILLDGVTMLELSGQTALAEKLRGVQTEFLAAVRKKTAVTLAGEVSLETLLEAIDEYAALIA